jgi:hypothetical protein
MSEGDELPPWAKPRRPEARPTWVVVLALGMFLFGGRQLVTGVSQLVNPTVEPATNENVTVQVSQDLKLVGDAVNAAFRAHPIAVSADASAKIVFGALLLLAVAAVLASDPRARRAALTAAWAGIAFQIGDSAFLFVICRKAFLAVAPMVAAFREPGAGEAFSRSLLWAVDIAMIGAGLCGIAFSVVLLRFFGGTRGRTFFGAGAAASARSL